MKRVTEIESGDDAGLVARGRAGERAAFTELVLRHQARVRVYLAYHVRKPEVVDDLAQEVFLIAYRRLGTFRGESAFRTWLHGIARTTLLEHLRVTARRETRKRDALVELLDEARLRAIEEPADDLALQGERVLAALEACLGSLPAERAQLVERHYFGARPLVELAEARGQKESAVRMALLRVRQALRACVERRLAEGGT